METHVAWIVFIKILFVFAILLGAFMPNNQLTRYKDKIETIFFISMALLLLYVFNPYTKHNVTSGEKHLLFIFGIVLLLTREWSQLI